MKEEEWRTTHDLYLFLRTRKERERTDRKTRLMAATCVLATLRDNERSSENENFIQRLMRLIENGPKTDWIAQRERLMGEWWQEFLLDPLSHRGLTNILRAILGTLPPFKTQPEESRAACMKIARDIYSNPFHVSELDPRWLTSSVLDLADGIYTDRAFERLPILADALMDAGCDHDEIIHHCRSPGPHVRGCWVVDLILGKK